MCRLIQMNDKIFSEAVWGLYIFQDLLTEIISINTCGGISNLDVEYCSLWTYDEYFFSELSTCVVCHRWRLMFLFLFFMSFVSSVQWFPNCFGLSPPCLLDQIAGILKNLGCRPPTQWPIPSSLKSVLLDAPISYRSASTHTLGTTALHSTVHVIMIFETSVFSYLLVLRRVRNRGRWMEGFRRNLNYPTVWIKLPSHIRKSTCLTTERFVGKETWQVSAIRDPVMCSHLQVD